MAMKGKSRGNRPSTPAHPGKGRFRAQGRADEKAPAAEIKGRLQVQRAAPKKLQGGKVVPAAPVSLFEP